VKNTDENLKSTPSLSVRKKYDGSKKHNSDEYELDKDRQAIQKLMQETSNLR
jgi:hypothetical protein